MADHNTQNNKPGPSKPAKDRLSSSASSLDNDRQKNAIPVKLREEEVTSDFDSHHKNMKPALKTAGKSTADDYVEDRVPQIRSVPSVIRFKDESDSSTPDEKPLNKRFGSTTDYNSRPTTSTTKFKLAQRRATQANPGHRIGSNLSNTSSLFVRNNGGGVGGVNSGTGAAGFQNKNVNNDRAGKVNRPGKRSVSADSLPSNPYPYPNDSHNYGFYDRKPPLTPSQRVYNKETQQFFGRTGSSWCKIILFYLVFYVVLVLFFYIYMKLWFKVRIGSGSVPLYKFKNQPDFNYQPNFDKSGLGMLEYDLDCRSNYMKRVKAIQTFLKPYKEKSVDLSIFGPCTSEKHFGYDTGSPCIFVKLNKIFDFQPLPYANLAHLPSDMPKPLQDYIKNLPYPQRNLVWLSCTDNADKFKDIHFYPKPGFSVKEATTIRLSKLDKVLITPVAVQFVKPPKDKIIVISCHVWARNIKRTEDIRRIYGKLQIKLKITS